MSAYGFSEDSAKRIARVVKAVEGDTTEPTRIGPMLGGSTMSVVKVTALGSPLNTGQRVDYHASNNTMNDINEVKIKEVSGAALTVGARYMGQFSGYDSTGKPVFLVKASTAASGGSATIEVVTDVICTPTGIEVSTVTLSGADYDNAVIRQFLALSDVTPSSYLGNQGRVVKVNDAATALEFGAIGEGPSYTTFIALSDTPNVYGSNAYKTLTVSSTNNSVVFSANNVTTINSITGGGNPNDPNYVALSLVNDTTSPGNDRFYATTNAGVKGWRTLTLKGATDFPANYTSAGGKFLKVNAGATAVEFVGPLAAVTDVAAHTISSADLATAVSTTQTAIDDLKTQVNLLLARIRSQGLIS